MTLSVLELQATCAAREEQAPLALGLALILPIAAGASTGFGVEADRVVRLTLAYLEDPELGAQELRKRLALASKGRAVLSLDPVGKDAGLAFVYPGSGNHFPGMGREAGLRWPSLFSGAGSAQGAGATIGLIPKLAWGSSLDEMNRDPAGLIQCQVAVGVAMTKLAQSFGLQPSHALGYSLGETTALFGLGAWSQPELMSERMQRSRLFTHQLAGTYEAARAHWKAQAAPRLPSPLNGGEIRWKMGVVSSPSSELAAPLALEPLVYLLIINTRDECVIGGEAAAVDAFVEAQGLALHPIEGVTSVHCSVVEEVATAYRDFHKLPTKAPEGIRFYSGASAKPYDVNETSAADAILAQALHGINMPALVERAYEDGARIFIELGPGASCTRMIESILGSSEPKESKATAARPFCAIALHSSKRDPELALLQALAAMHAERLPLDLRPLESSVGRSQPQRAPARAAQQVLVLPVGYPPPRAPSLEGRGSLAPPHREGSASAPTTSSPQKPPRAQPASEIMLRKQSPKDSSARVPVSGFLSSQTPLEPFASDASGTTNSGLIEALSRSAQARSRAHQDFLALAQSRLALIAEGARVAYDQAEVPFGLSSPAGAAPLQALIEQPQASTASLAAAILEYPECVEFAVGRIGEVFGPEFSSIDAHPTRVRLPEGPLMLVDRVLELEGVTGSLGSGRVVTEHRVTEERWYLDDERIPTGVCVESGQADLLLSAYLGIDFQTQGLAVYRLLDAKVSFHRSLPRVGETIVHDIRIREFFEQGGTWFFRFDYDSRVNGEALLTMRGGLAGFFSQDALLAGEGVKVSRLDREKRQPRPALTDRRYTPPIEGLTLDEDALSSLRRGDLQGAFGEAFAALPLQSPTHLPTQDKLHLIDRISHCDEREGWYGRGLVRADKLIHADDWFLTCHFVDDQVMPGTLMYESALQALRVYLMRMGFVDEAARLSFGPVPGVESKLKCRGQVVASTREVQYELHIKELGLEPVPYALADVLMYADGKAIVEIEDMSLQATGLAVGRLDALWGAAAQGQAPKALLYDTDRIVAYAEGRPSEAFGAPYRIFDEERRIARLPRAPYLFMDRVTRVKGRPFEFRAGAEVDAEVDLQPQSWVFEDRSLEHLPFAVLLEIALQPCGWLAAYVGSALQSQVDLHFRNLGGKARQLAPVDPTCERLYTRTSLTECSKSGDTIIQHFKFEVATAKQTVYLGTTYFGFFTKEALQHQVGLRGAALWPLPADKNLSEGMALDPALMRTLLYGTPRRDAATKAPMSASPSKHPLRMLDRLDFLSLEGGPFGFGMVQGSKQIDPEEWFFQAHFYQDPVWPGSLGVEAFLQLMQAYAQASYGDVRLQANCSAERQVAQRLERGRSPQADPFEHSWSYRGQVIQPDHGVIVQAAIRRRDDREQVIVADGLLSVDGRIIYEMKNFSIKASREGRAQRTGPATVRGTSE